ncbi:hypothetical protein HLB23_13130 [Nocardia uniformis]|uniref:AMIN-like domain-containing protein n=1 Tax=Nocardia uniformis TaxID=53432 RepID=A0A849C4S2_9NOCA|nr:hypothetical protein [Nocardia uniformis]NNH70797.1 hypothetical protein [Nocardia uniformis]
MTRGKVAMLDRLARSAALVLVSLLATVVVSACGSEPPTQLTTQLTTPPVDQYAAKDRTPDPGAVAIGLTNISLSPGDSADRVTFEFTGDAVPGWAVHYVREAVQNGTHAVFPVAGETIIEVLIREAANPFGSGVPPYSGPETLTDPATISIGEVRFASEVRGVTQAFIGLRTPQRGFRVTGLTDPARVVVEVDHR